jgi:hypothetical protein
VDVRTTGADIKLRADGLTGLARDIGTISAGTLRAAT